MQELFYTLLFQQLSDYFYLIDSFRNDDDFIATLLLMGSLVFLALAVISILLGLLFIITIVLLISAGIISTSVIVGLQQRSITKGFKTLFLSSAILGSSIVSVIFCIFLNAVYDWSSNNMAMLIGLVLGIILGTGLGLLAFKAMAGLIRFLTSKYRK
ncbi:hypothetical protein OHD16_18570 [Sphingobacterium sp. ML3W]|uniref:hypothetical protein n=1 Tax=Sphingobacterium sp. ML3W TaxID=1538644 RepID=UPI00249B0924|nr:hypothetical protein [Sphingobacterium sp. ML3W]WFA81961.1 hypothetical protein OGI71_11710 [Sphingobacterium sp. ML3W]